MRPALTLTRIFAYRHPVDLRKSIDGLSSLVEGVLGADPLSGALYVFVNRRRDKVKLLYWERNGFCIWYKRLERERFSWPTMTEASLVLSGQQLNWLLDGYDIDRLIPHAERRYQTVL
ncbi:MAG: IS66 family insertion sequence element accessory protein TnpB [Proteobacteria bacterium]|nr:IS66 family insertion sequence element accessory protein TnpB [Pseudomonadota bacterium]